LQSGELVQDFYNICTDNEALGHHSGQVLLATRRADGCEVVVKIRSKQVNHGGSDREWRGVMSQLMAMPECPHVIQIDEILEDDRALYVIMPRCDGGTLTQFLLKRMQQQNPLLESECKRILRQVLIAVGHLHENNLIHQDIKPDNIMLDSDMSDPAHPYTLKLIDFDTCVGWIPGKSKASTFTGTEGYIAPECLMGGSCPQSDLFSVGVLFYILFVGCQPWNPVTLQDCAVGSPSAKKIYNSMKAMTLEWDSTPWSTFHLACDACQKLLAFDPRARPWSARQVLSHRWLAFETEDRAIPLPVW